MIAHLLAATWVQLLFSLDILRVAASLSEARRYEIPAKMTPAYLPETRPDQLFFFEKLMYPGEFLIHFHIPKTGGTTFHFLFDKTNCGHRPHGVKNVYDIVSRFDSERGSCGFFSQEFLSFSNLSKALAFSTKPAKLLTFFRTPISHVLSAVGHMTRKKIKKCTGLKLAMSPECDFYKIDNIQTTYLGSRDLSTSLQNLHNLFWIGITEHYDASVCLLSYQLGQFDSRKCNCAGTLVKPGNRGIKVSHSLPDLRDVGHLTQLDTVLYQNAYELFLKRVYYAEKDLGLPILCEGRDGAEALHMRDYLGGK